VDVWVPRSSLTLINPNAPQLLDYINKTRSLSRNRRGRAALKERLAKWAEEDSRQWRLANYSNPMADQRAKRRSGVRITREISTLLRAHAKLGIAAMLSRVKFIAVDGALHPTTLRVLQQRGIKVFTPGCGHPTMTAPTTVMHRPRGLFSSKTYCATCMQRMRNDNLLVDATNDRGVTAPHFKSEFTLYKHSDDEWYTYVEPPLVGRYHSSKGIHTKALPHLTGKPMSPHEVTIGYELEFTRHANARYPDQTPYAREINKRIMAAIKDIVPRNRKYATFEHDGSVWFEMVSGFGPLDLHRKVLLDVFKGEGKHRHAFYGELNSHDGGACGLHVHLAKPTSLRHALKMVKFWHATRNKPLIEKVARRYDNRYAKIINDKAFEHPFAVRRAWDSQRAMARNKPPAVKRDYVKQAITDINPERYEALNFKNPATVEIRLFRGTLVPATAVACLEFAYMTWLFARDLPSRDMLAEHFVEYINHPDRRHDTKYLRAYLASSNGGPPIPGVFIPRQKEEPKTAPKKETPKDNPAEALLNSGTRIDVQELVRNDIANAFQRHMPNQVNLNDIDFGEAEQRILDSLSVQRPARYRPPETGTVTGRIPAQPQAQLDVGNVRNSRDLCAAVIAVLQNTYPDARDVDCSLRTFGMEYEARLRLGSRTYAYRFTDDLLRRDGLARAMDEMLRTLRVRIERDRRVAMELPFQPLILNPMRRLPDDGPY
jgi:hypothetical protein